MGWFSCASTRTRRRRCRLAHHRPALMAQRKKSDLPTKICPVCERPFSWRARWKNQWDQIVYCSRRCSGQRRRKS
ncbi:MAG: DUF2256 domain-containing protein [Halieaceae bacterium]